MNFSKKKKKELEDREETRDSYLVEVRARIWGYAFEDLHILNEQLTSSFDLCIIDAILPGREENRQG